MRWRSAAVSCPRVWSEQCVPAIEVLKDIFWVGVVDWNARNFHGFTYSTHRGTSYNAYLIVDEKVALVDTVYGPFSSEMIERIREVIEPSKIDYIVANHVETDHSGAIGEVLNLAPDAKVIGTAKCREGLEKHYFGNWGFQVVKTGDTIELGKHTLTFLEAPMLHWPDSMFTYISQDELLLPNDAFGQHLASSKLFDDEVDEKILMDEASKYYANILWPLSSLVNRKIQEVQRLGLKIKMIAPSHGIIWRSNTAKIIEAYLRWANGESKGKVVVVYDTMWNSTEKMAFAIVEGLKSEGIEVALFRIPFSDRGDIFKELLEARGIMVGSSTINNSILPTLAPFLEEIGGLRPLNKVAAVFGSYGWGGQAANIIEERLEKAGIQVILPSLKVRWVPDRDEIKMCFEFGRKFANKIK